MAICAGVQKVSRPMERCQEASQCMPKTAEAREATTHQTYQGIGAAVACVCGEASVPGMG